MSDKSNTYPTNIRYMSNDEYDKYFICTMPVWTILVSLQLIAVIIVQEASNNFERIPMTSV